METTHDVSLKGEKSLEETRRYKMSQNGPYYIEVLNYLYINMRVTFSEKLNLY